MVSGECVELLWPWTNEIVCGYNRHLLTHIFARHSSFRTPWIALASMCSLARQEPLWTWWLPWKTSTYSQKVNIWLFLSIWWLTYPGIPKMKHLYLNSNTNRFSDDICSARPSPPPADDQPWYVCTTIPIYSCAVAATPIHWSTVRRLSICLMSKNLKYTLVAITLDVVNPFRCLFSLFCVYACSQATQYLWKTDQLNRITSCPAEIEKIKVRARSLLVVVSTPPSNDYGNFTNRVREYNALPPFNFTLPTLFQKYESVGRDF